jgi:hypothetical protein
MVQLKAIYLGVKTLGKFILFILFRAWVESKAFALFIYFTPQEKHWGLDDEQEYVILTASGN